MRKLWDIQYLCQMNRERMFQSYGAGMVRPLSPSVSVCLRKSLRVESKLFRRTDVTLISSKWRT